MERFRGTKGEWTLDHEWGRVVLVKSGEDTLASVWNQEVYSISEEQMRANAQLISKAPEMLEMLTFMVTDEDVRADLRLNSLLNDVEQLIKEAITIQDKQHSMYKVKQEDLIGDIKDFPIEVVQKMVERQVEQGNVADVAIFQKSKEGDMTGGGFNWFRSTEGDIFWRDVIGRKNFDKFFEKYPKSEQERPTTTKEVMEELKEALSDMSASSIEASKLNIPEIETQGLTESFVNDFKEYLNTIEKQIMYARTLLNDIKPEPLLPDVDFSILNNTDWFVAKSIYDSSYIRIFKGRTLNHVIYADLWYNPATGDIGRDDEVFGLEAVGGLCKATPEDLAPMFEKHPELAPPKIGDWGVFLDDNYDGIAIGRIEELEWDSDDDGAWNVYYLHGQPYGRFYKINPDEPFNKIVDDFIKSVES